MPSKKGCLEFLEKGVLKKLNWLAQKARRTPEQQLHFLVESTYDLERGKPSLLTLPKREILTTNPLNEVPTPPSNLLVDTRIEKYQKEYHSFQNLKGSGSARTRSTKGKRAFTPGFPPSELPTLLEDLKKEMSSMSYVLVDLNQWVPEKFTPLEKEKFPMGILISRLEDLGFFVSLNLPLARDYHSVVFHEEHDFFLSHEDFQF